MKFEFQPRWKEELVGTYGDRRFTIEITMGRLHVFFPIESTWEDEAPDWAKGKWSEAREQAEGWAQSQGIPFDVDEQAWVVFHEKEDGLQDLARDRLLPGQHPELDNGRRRFTGGGMPLPLLGAVIINCGIILLSTIAFALLAAKMTGFGLVIGTILAGLPIFGLLLIAKRKQSARRFNIWLIGFWALVAGLVNLSAGLQGDIGRVAVGIVVLSVTLPTIVGLIRSKRVRAWLFTSDAEVHEL